MNSPQPMYDHEIDLFELIQTIWNKKIWVIFATVISTGLGGLYTVTTPTVYQISVKVTFHHNSHPKTEFLQLIQQNSDHQWVINPKNQTFIIETQNPAELDAYASDIVNATKQAQIELLQVYKDELSQIANLAPSLLGTEAVAKTVLRNQRFINGLKTRDSYLATLSDPVQSVKSPKVNLVLASAFILGGIVGVLMVIVRKAYENRIEI